MLFEAGRPIGRGGGWWLEDEIMGDGRVYERFSGFGYSGVPIAPDIIFLISDKEGKELLKLIENF